MSRVRLLGVDVEAVTPAGAVEQIEARVSRRLFTTHSVVNVAKLVRMREDGRLRRSVESCDLVHVDGMGLVWAGRLLGCPIPARVAGIDLFLDLVRLAAGRGYPIYLLGGRPEVVERTALELKRAHPGLAIAGLHHGYFSDESEIVARIASSGARLLFVAMSSPLKENFIDKWGAALGVDFVMGVGGSFDVVTGKVRRAPLWMQKAGLEWAFRVGQEPRRMWRRYASTNLRFAAIVAGALLAEGRKRLALPTR